MGKCDYRLRKGQAMDYMYFLFRIGYLIRRLGSRFLKQGLGFQVRLIDEESQRLVEIVSDGEAGEIKIQGDSANLYCVRVR